MVPNILFYPLCYFNVKGQLGIVTCPWSTPVTGCERQQTSNGQPEDPLSLFAFSLSFEIGAVSSLRCIQAVESKVYKSCIIYCSVPFAAVTHQGP